MSDAPFEEHDLILRRLILSCFLLEINNWSDKSEARDEKIIVTDKKDPEAIFESQRDFYFIPHDDFNTIARKCIDVAEQE